ncbi:carboxynorspermidine decarboxylase [Marinigracilibium pacificum]|uniref:Carboxynorspermidine/carboxyspermidine decarboxylase n=1 Tax=Marinigracilibium pacificum TaxID=2729599 RepID=A0A848J2X3_9BACT|nr:carboxynorspermidine decarboxylase [Marinigracilibium pacificum]NMM49855.1 carboxynorspermidine decarboxylase [Marinigracilibium pacificum]
MAINYENIPSPCFVLDKSRLIGNLELMNRVQKESGASIILAFKGFAMWSVFPTVRQYLSGATASSLSEARLCFEEMKSKAHTYSPAYLPEEFDEILSYSSHITFNSLKQAETYKDRVMSSPDKVSMGLRVNPGWSDVETMLYNPSAPGSRLGVSDEELSNGLPDYIEGLHFHVLCESPSESLVKVLESFEKLYGKYLGRVKWVNFGGGHLMTKKGYNVELLIDTIRKFKEKYPHLEVILEPGSAAAWDTGVLVSRVLDIVERKGVKTAILDVSFTAHMPDTLEMPYRPRIIGAGDPTEGKPTYKLGGVSCLAGDYMHEYSFDKELNIGDKVIFEDMIHYTMVKTTTFNGITHPSIAIWEKDNSLNVVKEFGYEDFRDRLS